MPQCGNIFKQISYQINQSDWRYLTASTRGSQAEGRGSNEMDTKLDKFLTLTLMSIIMMVMSLWHEVAVG